MILIGALIIIILGAMAGEIEISLTLALLFGLFTIQNSFNKQLKDLQQQIKTLKQRLDADDVKTKIPEQPVQTPQALSSKTEALNIPPPDDEDLVIQLDMPEAEVAREAQPVAVQTKPQPQSQSARAQTAQPTETKATTPFDILIDRANKLIVSYFTDGNIFVRVGLLVLFFGVAFLLKYAAENSRIPIEYRFLSAGLGGLALVVVGWRLRLKKEVFALLLQGGGIGIIYITIFASYRIAHLIPSNLTFVLLVAFALITTALAVLQNSRSLAIYAVLGGFLAPFLASSGSGNYIGLFSYYAALNLVVFGVAWFKSWRLLNLMSFAFTFGVYTLWFITSYREPMLLYAGLFLALFFVMYSVLGVLYALKQEQNLKGIVDGSLVFGTPLICSSIAMVMLRYLEYGIAIVCMAVGLYYIVLARFLWSRIGEQTRLLAESMLAVGVVFATLAIPYALDGHWSSAAWALEAAGILWVSLRQQRFYAQVFAVILQVASGVLFLFRNIHDMGDMPWINPAFLGGSFIALGALISSRLLYQQDSSHRLHQAHWLFYGWGLGWWLVSSLIQIDHYIDNRIFAVLVLLIFTVSVLGYLDRIRKWDWLPVSFTLGALLPVQYLLALASWQMGNYFLQLPDMFGWIALLALNYFLIFKLEDMKWPVNYYLALYSGWALLVVTMLSLELEARFFELMPDAGNAWSAWFAVLPLISIWWVRQGKMAVLQRFGQPLQLSITALMVGYLVIWVVFNNLSNDGAAYPLPYIPLINPIDLVQIVFFIAVYRSMKLLGGEIPEYRQMIFSVLGGLIFIWISTLYLRSMHHYMPIQFSIEHMLLNARIQTGLSILWTLIGMAAILFASRKSMRTLWITGAVLVGIVVVKLIFTDLRASGTIERIVSFLAVGGLLVAMGYFSPIPPKEDDGSEDGGSNQKSQVNVSAGQANE